jgi:hypothetical protein
LINGLGAGFNSGMGLGDKTVQQGNYLSHRILNYDAM